MTGGRTITGQFWRYALPSMFSQLLNSFFIIVDGFLWARTWGRGPGGHQRGLAPGGGDSGGEPGHRHRRRSRLATALGRGRGGGSPAGAGATPWCCWPGGGPAGGGLYLGYPYLLPLMGANAELYPLAAEYCRVVCVLAACQVATTGMLPLVRGSGRAVAAMGDGAGPFGEHRPGLAVHPSVPMGAGRRGVCHGAGPGPVRGGCGAGAAVPQRAAGAGRTVPLTVGAGAGNPALWNFPFGLSLSTSVILLITNLRGAALRRHPGRGGVCGAELCAGQRDPAGVGRGDGIQPLLSYARGAGTSMRWPSCAAKGLAWHWSGSGVQRVCFALRAPPPDLGASPAAVAEGAAAMWTLARPIRLWRCCGFIAAIFARWASQGQQHSGVRRAAGRAAGFFCSPCPFWWGLEGVWIAYPAAVAVMAAAALWLLRRRHLALRPQAGGEGAA